MTSEMMKEIEGHLRRLGVLCTERNPAGICTSTDSMEERKNVYLFDDWISGLYDPVRLLQLLPDATAEDFWQDIQEAELES
jgi:hypothetical protein